MWNSRHKTALRVLLVLFALAGLTYWAADLRDKATLALHYERHPQRPFDLDDDTRKLTKLKPEAISAGVVENSTIESINAAPYTGTAQWDEALFHTGPGGILGIGFRRPDGTLAQASIKLQPAVRPSGAPSGTMSLLRQSLLFFLLPLVCMAIGYWVVLVKPTEPNAWLLMVLLSLPEVFFALGTGLATGAWLAFRLIYFQLLQFGGPITLLLFGIYFPERSRFDTRFPWLKWLVLAPMILIAITFVRSIYGDYYLGGNPEWLVRAGHWIDPTVNTINLLCVILYLGLILDKLRTASTPDSRRRLRVLLTGTSFGVASLLIVFVLLPDLGINTSAATRPWLAYTGAVAFMVAPLTLAYVVLVQRAMDVSILIRTGTKYALAKATLWAVQGILAAVVAWNLLIPLFTRKQIQTSELWQPVLLIFLLALLRGGLARRGQTWLDRKFFRETYDSEVLLAELSSEVRKFTETTPLLTTVARRVAETLHVQKIGMLLRDGQSFCVAQTVGIAANGDGASLSLTLPAHSATVFNLSRTNAPALLYRDNPDSWFMLAGQEERQLLDTLEAELLLPLSGRNKLIGVMALGPKQSEAAYSRSDLHLLHMLANQTGLALEISELAHSLAREAAQRERANREMEIAREVQERLFPQVMPEIPGGSIAGFCRPAQGIGGDYYDAFTLQDGRIGLAIGDVSGKGISAALLMASLRASLRGVSLDNPHDFAVLMHKVNRLVYEASADNRYATFFFGAYDPATGALDCVNAGHNAPLILRRTGDTYTVIRLEADGPVVGLLPSAPYSEQHIILQPGDLLVAYTDGISEAMTTAEEEWGEERMVQAAVEAASSPASQTAHTILKAIVQAADRFTAGAPQHDDMTILIFKLDIL